MDDRLKHLIAVLEADDVTEKIRVIQESGDSGDPDVIEVLLPVLSDDNNDLRQAAVVALGKISQKHPLPFDALMPLLADADDAVRQTVNHTLTQLGARAVIPLIDALQHEDSTVRGAVADLLGEIQDERAFEPLLDVYRTDSSQWVRSRAQKAIDQLPIDDAQKQQAEPFLKPPENLLEHRRSKTKDVDWPSLGDDDLLANARGQDADPDNMTVEEIRDFLDNLDLRLINGKISEATHQQLYARWQSRLP